jgi:hypothetical protein
MDWKHLLKAFAFPLVIGGILFGLIKVMDAFKPTPLAEKIVVVDTSGLIRVAASSFARREEDNPLILNKKLEVYKTSLVKSLNEFAIQNQCIVFTANQVFGDIPDMTEAFLSFVEEQKQ